MKKSIGIILAGTILFSSGCANMSRSEKVVVGATVAIGAVITLLILGSKNKGHHHHRSHHRGCGCHRCHH